MKQYRLTVEEDQENERIDRYICNVLADLSRSYIKKLCDSGSITANGRTVKPSFVVKPGDEIEVSAPDSVIPDILPEDIPLDILYEDDDVLVVNKPKGMVVHPAAGHYSHTLVNAVMFHCHDLSGINGVTRPGIVHRIDKDTSGSVIICKNDAAHTSIAAQLEEHTVKREYIGIVTGVMENDSGTVDSPIGRSPKDRKKMAVVAGGKRAVTHYEVEERLNGYTLVRFFLETGRTHQIRVHMASIHHPLAGDEVYGSGRKTPVPTYGQALHARILGFLHPRTGEYIETFAPAPEYFGKFLNLCK